MAGNCINFALRVLQASRPGVEPDNNLVRGIAIAAAAFACIVHAVSRRGGIWLNNTLAVIKVLILLLIIAVTLAVVGNGIRTRDGKVVEDVFRANMDPGAAFKTPVNPSVGVATENPDGATVNGYAAAFLSISEPPLRPNTV